MKKNLNGYIKWFFLALAVAGIVWNAATLDNDVSHIASNIEKIEQRLEKIEERILNIERGTNGN